MTTCLERELRQILPLPKETPEEAAKRKARKKTTRRIRRRFPTPLPRAESTDFEYVLKDVVLQKVAFGTTNPQNFGIYGRGAPYSRIILNVRRETDRNVLIGPTTYDTPTTAASYPLFSKKTSIYGVGIGARRAKRFVGTDIDESTPGPGHYDIQTPPPKQNAVPFNSSARRKFSLNVTSTPGPGSHCEGGPSRLLWKYHFGNAPREPVPLVTIHCTNGLPIGNCFVCGEELPAGKEYWRNSAEQLLLCIHCMRVEKKATAKSKFKARFTHWQLQAFQRERDCTDFHEHEGTTAKIHLVPDSVIQKRLRLEAYLGRYFDDDGPPEDPDRDKRPAQLVDRPDRYKAEPFDVCAYLESQQDLCPDICMDAPSLSSDENFSTSFGKGICFEDYDDQEGLDKSLVQL